MDAVLAIRPRGNNFLKGMYLEYRLCSQINPYTNYKGSFTCVHEYVPIGLR